MGKGGSGKSLQNCSDKEASLPTAFPPLPLYLLREYRRIQQVVAAAMAHGDPVHQMLQTFNEDVHTPVLPPPPSSVYWYSKAKLHDFYPSDPWRNDTPLQDISLTIRGATGAGGRQGRIAGDKAG